MRRKKKCLHPLEALALAELPEDARVCRLVALYREGKFGSPRKKMRLKDTKRVFKRTSEPRGRQGALSKLLCAEFKRQEVIAKKRWKINRGVQSCLHEDYYPDFGMHLGWGLGRRVKALARKRIGPIKLNRRVKWRRHFLPSGNIRDARVRRDSALLVMRPGATWREGSYHYGEHNWTCYLLYRVGEATGGLLISRKCQTVKAAINYLKRSSVISAEKKGYPIEIDWANRCFRTRAPNRKKWREIPFKEAKRNRR